tara:strand:+ start:899 stop:1285 length:387 start_codon:yes stop_codon:yes gene_type:complete
MIAVNDLNKQSYYVLPGYQAMLVMAELKEVQDISAHLLKIYVEQTDVADWEGTVVPDVAELYSGCRACIQMLEFLMKQEPPPEYRDRITEGGICVSGQEYIGFMALMETMRELKRSIESRFNISFEVH